MPTELEELVEFLHHGNTQIRQIAAENLVPYSKAQASIFKSNQLAAVKDLKLLVKDYAPIAKNALTILINISEDREVLQSLAKDDLLLETLLLRITNPKEPTADLLSMLLANLTKHDSLARLIPLSRSVPSPSFSLSTSPLALNQLLDLFTKGSSNTYNPKATFDYLAYLFADLAKFPDGSSYFTTPQPYDGLHPISKLLPFTTHASSVRRLGAVSTLKNFSFFTPSHQVLLNAPLSALPYVLLPLASGKDNYSDSESESLPEELQLLDPSVEREKDTAILKVLLETLLLWTTEREGREELRQKGVYFVVRELHLGVEDEDVREGAERLVNVLMRDEEGEENVVGRVEEIEAGGGAAREGRMIVGSNVEDDGEGGGMGKEKEESDEDDDKIVEVF